MLWYVIHVYVISIYNIFFIYHYLCFYRMPVQWCFAFWIADYYYFSSLSLLEVHTSGRDKANSTNFLKQNNDTNSISSSSNNIAILCSVEENNCSDEVCLYRKLFSHFVGDPSTEKCRYWIIHYKSLEPKVQIILIQFFSVPSVCKDTVGVLFLLFFFRSRYSIRAFPVIFYLMFCCQLCLFK